MRDAHWDTRKRKLAVTTRRATRPQLWLDPSMGGTIRRIVLAERSSWVPVGARCRGRGIHAICKPFDGLFGDTGAQRPRHRRHLARLCPS